MLTIDSGAEISEDHDRDVTELITDDDHWAMRGVCKQSQFGLGLIGTSNDRRTW